MDNNSPEGLREIQPARSNENSPRSSEGAGNKLVQAQLERWEVDPVITGGLANLGFRRGQNKILYQGQSYAIVAPVFEASARYPGYSVTLEKGGGDKYRVAVWDRNGERVWYPDPNNGFLAGDIASSVKDFFDSLTRN